MDDSLLFQKSLEFYFFLYITILFSDQYNISLSLSVQIF